MRKFRFLTMLLLTTLLFAACKPVDTTPEATQVEEAAPTEETSSEEKTATSEETEENEEVAETVDTPPAECRALKDPIFPYPYINESDWAIGPEDAAVDIIIYTDLQCPACAYYHPFYTDLYEAHAEDTRLAIRHFPLNYHPHAQMGAQAAETIGILNGVEDMYEFFTNVFLAQKDWEELTPEEFLTYVTDLAESDFDIASDTFIETLNSEEVLQNVSDDFDSGIDFVSGTPMILLNGIPLMYMPVGSFEEAYQFALALPEKQYDSCPEMTIDPEKEYLATVETTKGSFVMQLFPKSAPLTVNSFVFLANEGYYAGVPFHRVIPGFVAQAGDFTGTGIFGPGYEFDIEIDPTLSHDKAGMVSMANSGSDKNGSQFFITYSPQTALDGGYTIFGEIVEGMNIVESLQAIDPQNNTEAVTLDLILSISIEEK
ncbi:MAG: peptidylprolyl isomerase [Anaerolineaceae bacterium]|nr:peptidylprolyl isomerase [Anaerolineaceae bacterium]